MSPTKFHQDEHAKRVINGPRPSPLRISQDSNPIRKSSPRAPVPNYSSFPAPRLRNNKSSHQQRKPVIIYTHSPKIIHAQARDFMALVQSLTGISPSLHQSTTQNEDQNVDVKIVRHDDNESSSSGVTDDKYLIGEIKERSSALVSPISRNPNPYLADMPLFTPNSSDLFCSPRPLFRYSDMVSSSPNMANSLSPSFLEFMKGLPEY
ncbi:hypothetical protein LguiA_032451 [Lonicera macranthoides]